MSDDILSKKEAEELGMKYAQLENHLHQAHELLLDITKEFSDLLGRIDEAHPLSKSKKQGESSNGGFSDTIH